MTPLAKRVAIYGRFSSARQNPTSADDQLRQCEERVRLNGWRVVHRFTDEAVSGTDNKRPGYQGLQRAVKKGEIDIVLAESLSRFSRNQGEIANFFDVCRYNEVALHTLSEGEISRMHIGMLGTMNAVYLEALADATYRGIESKVLAGKSAGGRAYGYRVPRHPNGQPITGELEIVADEAAVIRRIFTDYANGLSPRAIVAALNAEGIPAPHGKDQGDSMGSGGWRANALHGNRQRGTGILNNELYAGRRIWNRQRFVRKPGEKKRIARLNPASEWKVDDVPQLRIVPEELWARVRARQERLDATRQDNDTGDIQHLSGSHAIRRPTHLLSGLLRCGCCGGTLNIGGSNPRRYYCSNSRQKGPAVCRGIPGIAQDKIEALVLNGLRDQLMQPEAVAEFIRRYQAHQRELDNDRRDRLSRIRSAMAATDKEIANILTAIKAGIFTNSTKAELETLEARKAQHQVDLASASTAAPTLPDDLAEIYQEKVEDLVTSLNDPTTRVQASEAIRALVDKVVVGWDDNGHTIELIGELAALLAMGTNGNAAGQLSAAALSSLKLVAGAGFEPAAFRL